jgi:hypothetical protein
MLGWDIFVKRQSDSEKSPALAAWETGLGGIDWLEDLVFKGGDGYPLRYLIPGGTVAAILAQGVPKGTGPLVLGDDYVQPSGWTGRVRVDIARMRTVDPSEMLLVEAWDQS